MHPLTRAARQPYISVESGVLGAACALTLGGIVGPLAGAPARLFGQDCALLTAAGATAGVVALAAHAQHRHSVVKASAFVCGLVGALGLLSWQPLLPYGPPSLGGGVALGALSVATVSSNGPSTRSSRLPVAMALLMMCAGLNALMLFASSASASPWTVRFGMSPHMAVASLLLAGYILLREARAGHPWFGTSVTYGLPAVVAVASLTFSASLREGERAGVRSEMATELRRLTMAMAERQRLYEQAVARLQQRIQDAEGSIPESFSRDAARIVADSGGVISSLALSDAEGVVQSVQPPELLLPLRQPDFMHTAERRAVRDAAVATRRPALTPPMQLAGGELGFTAVYPIIHRSVISGFVSASFNLARIESIAAAESPNAIRVSWQPHTEGKSAGQDAAMCQTREVTLGTATLRVEACPDPDLVARRVTWLPVGNAIRGLALAGLIGFLGISLERSRHQSARLEGLLKERDAARMREQQATRHFEMLFENAPVGMILWEDADHAVLANRAALQLLDIEPDALSSLSLPHLMADRALFDTQAAALRLVGTFPSVSTCIITPTGGEVDVVISGAACSSSEVGTHALWLFVLDNTVSAAASRDRHRHLQELEKQATELVQAWDRANEATEAKSRFLAAMSHEIRTPMNGVLGMLQLLRTAPLSEEHAEYLATAASSADTLLALLNDILDFSKIEAGKLELSEAPFDLCDTLETVADLFAERAFGKGLDFVTDLDMSARGTVLGDAARVRQVVSNLLSNAIKFTEQGLVTLSARRESDSVRVSVTDTGIGISTDALHRLFQPFTQAGSEIAPRFGGTGLGLAISQQLAVAMGGSISVSSVAGEGSTFTFAAPLPIATPWTAPPLLSGSALCVVANPIERAALARQLARLVTSVEEAVAPDEALRQVVRLPSQPPSIIVTNHDPNDCRLLHEWATTHGALFIQLRRPGQPRIDGAVALSLPARFDALQRLCHSTSGSSFPVPFAIATQASLERQPSLRILVVDDNQVNRLVAQRLAEKLGHRVRVVDGGQAALAVLASESIDVVLMDCQMPDMDGYETTRRLRAQHGRDIRVVALTASASAADQERCFQAGMDAFLSKPFRAQALQDVLTRTAA